MNKTRFLFAAVCGTLLAAGQVQAQISFQTIGISFLAQYQTNMVHPNADNTATNIDAYAPNILITTGNVIKAIAVDLAGEKWTTWAGSHLVREINLATTNEGIFLRKGALQTNVSQYFGGFSNNFTGSLASHFPIVANFANQMNAGAGANYQPPIEVGRGIIYERPGTNTVDYSSAFGLHSLAFSTTNLQFNLVGTSSEFYKTVSGRSDGTTYQQRVKWGTITFSGIFSINVTTNIFDSGTNTLPVFLGGPIHGTLALSPAVFSSITPPVGP
ncbi:MAG TPA: hypothetical protein VFC44_06220 [Candidatus Saccharimonadales bacterium]|nr:hypothetical protein [Candidatus Saccharimonadales bacterium]